MTQKLPMLLPLIVSVLLSGCDLNSSTGTDLLNEFENTPSPAPEAAAPDTQTQPAGTGSTPSNPPSSAPSPSSSTQSPPSSGQSASGFLWKPTSESTGNLVVLLPPSTRGRTQGVATLSGSFGTESARMRHEHHNGGRPHFYFSRPGSAYGTNITVQALLTDGSIFSTVVPNGSQRFSR